MSNCSAGFSSDTILRARVPTLEVFDVPIGEDCFFSLYIYAPLASIHLVLYFVWLVVLVASRHKFIRGDRKTKLVILACIWWQTSAALSTISGFFSFYAAAVFTVVMTGGFFTTSILVAKYTLAFLEAELSRSTTTTSSSAAQQQTTEDHGEDGGGRGNQVEEEQQVTTTNVDKQHRALCVSRFLQVLLGLGMLGSLLGNVGLIVTIHHPTIVEGVIDKRREALATTFHQVFSACFGALDLTVAIYVWLVVTRFLHLAEAQQRMHPNPAREDMIQRVRKGKISAVQTGVQSAVIYFIVCGLIPFLSYFLLLLYINTAVVGLAFFYAILSSKEQAKIYNTLIQKNTRRRARWCCRGCGFDAEMDNLAASPPGTSDDVSPLSSGGVVRAEDTTVRANTSAVMMAMTRAQPVESNHHPTTVAASGVAGRQDTVPT